MASHDKTVKLWDVLAVREKLTLREHHNHVTCVSFHPDGSRLASGAQDGTVRIWNVAMD